MEKKSLLTELGKEREKWKALPKGERLEYFCSYYLTTTCIFLFLVICLFFFWGDIRESQREFLISGLILNEEISQEGEAFLTEGYRSAYPGKERQRSYLAKEYLLLDTEETLDQYRRAMAITAQVAAGELDFLILEEEALALLKGSGIFIGAEEFLPKQVLERLEGRLESSGGLGALKESSQSMEEGFTILSLEGSPLEDFFKERETGDKLWLAFTCLPERFKKVEAFVSYLLDTGKL